MRALVILVSLFFVLPAYANDHSCSKETETHDTAINECPHYEFKLHFKDCKYCHVGSEWRVKETSPEQGAYWPMGTTIDGDVGKYLLTTIAYGEVASFFEYLKFRNIKKAEIVILSPGGGVFSAKQILGLMDEYKAWGGTITTKCYGLAASAGFVIFLNGDHRIIHNQAHLMWHEMWSMKFIAIETPSKKEDEAETFRHIQDTMQQWIADRSKLTKEQLDKRVEHKDFWCNGTEAVETYGFADRLMK